MPRTDSQVIDADTVPADWSTGPQRTVPDITLLELFGRWVVSAPHAVAVSSGGRTLTYRELDEASTAAAALLSGGGVQRRSRVGVLVERSVDLVVGLLAVWKAGCVYLPLDIDHPAERLGYFVADAGAAAVLTRRALADRVPAGQAVMIALDDEPGGTHAPRRPVPEDAAYLIYTSGSTGHPKAVEVEHRSLVNVIGELERALRVSPADHWLTMAPATFDISLAELCVPLATGGRVTVTSHAEVRDAARLVRLIAGGGVTRMQAVPSQWQALVDAGLEAPELFGMTGGEALPSRLAAALTKRLQGIVNGYGPTETTILSTLWHVDADATEQISIGRPIANTRVYVLRDGGSEAAVGEPGELFIAGAGVARGYCGDDELTAAAFGPDPRGCDGDRMYRTGDRCRWRTDGNLEYLGRTDGQVKIRGQRVELGEVEAGIEMFAPVGAAVAVVREHDLVAFVVPSDPAAPPTPAQVREHAARTLTSAMAPTTVIVLDAFPLTGNGKIDRDALATAPASPAPPETTAETTAVTGDAFTTEVCALIQEVLGAERVGPADDFFDVGGHSLAVMRVAAAIAQKWQVEVASDVFYDTETVADLAAAVNALRAAR